MHEITGLFMKSLCHFLAICAVYRKLLDMGVELVLAVEVEILGASQGCLLSRHTSGCRFLMVVLLLGLFLLRLISFGIFFLLPTIVVPVIVWAMSFPCGLPIPGSP